MGTSTLALELIRLQPSLLVVLLPLLLVRLIPLRWKGARQRGDQLWTNKGGHTVDPEKKNNKIYKDTQKNANLILRIGREAVFCEKP